MGIQAPNYTQFPNQILDNLPLLSNAEFKVVAFICRQTFGYHKEKAKMSLSFLMQGTGLSKQGILNATESLEDWIEKTPCEDSFEYKLRVDPLSTQLTVNSVDTSETSLPVNSVDHTQSTQLTPLVNSVDTTQSTQLTQINKGFKERSKERSKKKKIANAIDRAIAPQAKVESKSPDPTATDPQPLEYEVGDVPELCTEQPAIADPPSPSQPEPCPVPTPKATGEDPPAPKKSRKRKNGKVGSARSSGLTADEIYALLLYPEKFESAWAWYKKRVDAVPPDRQGRRPSEGEKPEAAWEWHHRVELTDRLEEFKVGLMAIDFTKCGIKHLSRFIAHEEWRQHTAPVDESFLPLDEAPAPTVSRTATTVVGDGSWVDQWLNDAALVAWTAKHHLPGLPQFRDQSVTIAIAKTWYSDAKFDPKRLNQCAIAVEAYQEYQRDYQAREAALAQMTQVPVAVPVVQAAVAMPSPPVAPLEPAGVPTVSVEVKKAVWNDQIRRGQRQAVEKELANFPYWQQRLRYDPELNQVVEVCA